tara:strand:- start:151 stop:375 length:225 start_codon:yes stop_codon:yes gene_type:complete
MYETSDLGIAAYLMLKGLNLKSCGIHPTGRYCFELEDPHGIAEDLAMEFLKSDFTKYDDNMRTLRKMLKFKPRR